MMFKKKLLASAMATAMVAGAMVSGSAQAIRVSESGAGQVLLGAIYTTQSLNNDTASTNLTVVNTNTANAVKARIVLRSKKNSEECRDLVLYLTPGDVWRGVVMAGADGRPTLVSGDDSVIASYDTTGLVPTFATEAKPYSNALHTLTSGDSCMMGHIEVVGVYTATGNVPVFDPVTGAAAGSVNVKRGMSKSELYKIFMSPRANLVAPGVTSVDPTKMQLSGVVEVVSGGVRAALYPMLALRDGVNPGTAGVATKVIAADFEFVQGGTLPLGLGMGDGGRDNITDIEHALAAASLSSSYEQDGAKITNIALTYPTKYRHTNWTTALAAVPLPGGAVGLAGCPAAPAGATNIYSSPFAGNGAVKYGIESYDNSEGGPVCFQSPCGANSWTTDEVNYIDINGLSKTLNAPVYFSTSGWGRINMEAIAGCSYAGVPAIGYTHRMVGGTSYVFEPMTRPYMAP